MRFSNLVLALPLAAAHPRRQILDARDSMKHTFHFRLDNNNLLASVKNFIQSDPSDLSPIRKIEAEGIPYTHDTEIISDDEADRIKATLRNTQLHMPPTGESEQAVSEELEEETTDSTSNRLEEMDGPKTASSEMNGDDVSNSAVTGDYPISNEIGVEEEPLPQILPAPVQTSVVADDTPAPPSPQVTSTPETTQARTAAVVQDEPTFSLQGMSTLAMEDKTAVAAESKPTAGLEAAGSELNGNFGDQTANATLSSFQKYTLLVHDAVRGPHGVGNLTWDAALAQNATAWASRCVYEHSPQEMYGGGQNIAYQTDAKTELQGMQNSFQDWYYKEEPSWNYATHVAQPTSDNPSAVVGHFLAIVNGAFDGIGCAFVRCRKPMGQYTEWGYTVCNFHMRNDVDPRSQSPQKPKSSVPAPAAPPK